MQESNKVTYIPDRTVSFEQNYIEFAKMIAQRQTFEINTYKEAFEEAVYDDRFICYNRVTMDIEKHNFPDDQYSIIRDELKQFMSKARLNSSDFRKKLREYDTIFVFMGVLKKYKNYAIQKNETPDFILTNKNLRIGVEITALTEENKEIVDKIFDIAEAEKLNTAELQAHAMNKYKTSASSFRFKGLHNLTLIMPPAEEYYSRRECYAGQILKKIDDYRKIDNVFDQYIVLCDALKSMALTSADEVNDMLDMIAHSKLVDKILSNGECQFEIAILYENGEDGSLCCCECMFD